MGVMLGVGVWLGVKVIVGVDVMLGVRVAEGVKEGVDDFVGVGVAVEVLVWVGVCEAVGVTEGVGVTRCAHTIPAPNPAASKSRLSGITSSQRFIAMILIGVGFPCKRTKVHVFTARLDNGFLCWISTLDVVQFSEMRPITG